MGILIIGLIMVLVICIIAIISTYMLDQDNKEMQVIIASLTTENIQLKEDLKECKQTVKVLQRLYKADPCKDPRCKGCSHIDGLLCPYPKECSAMLILDK